MTSHDNTGSRHNQVEVELPKPEQYPVKWYRSIFWSMTILGLCNLTAPSIWGAMNSLGAGGAASPQLINADNALTFCFMVVSCYFSSTLVRYIRIKGALIFGTMVMRPMQLGSTPNNRSGTEWLVLLGAAVCGISAGVFWMAEAAIAIAYPEPWNRGKVIGYWLTYRLAGQILGGAINLGLNAKSNEAGKVELTITRGAVFELKETARLFLCKKFLLMVSFNGKAVFAEDIYFTYLVTWFSVRSRALGSFLSGIIAVVSGWILSTRVRTSFWVIVILQDAWWTWTTALVTRYRFTRPMFYWIDGNFGEGLGVFVFLTVSFQLNYMFLYFIIHNLAKNESEVVRHAALLRGTESAWQAISYGLTSLVVFAEVGGVYINFGLWTVAIWPAWLVVREFGTSKVEQVEERASSVDTPNLKSSDGKKLQAAGKDGIL